MEQYKKKYPLKAKILLVLFLLAPFFSLAINCNTVYGITPAEYSASMSRPSVAIWFFLYLASGISCIIVEAKNFQSYNGTEKTAKIINNRHRIVGYYLIALAVVDALVYSYLLCKAFNKLNFGRSCPTTSVMMIMFGLVLMWDMLFYLLWMSTVEKAMSHILFTPSDIFMPVMLRNIIIACMSTVALCCLCLAPLLDPEFQGMPLHQIFKEKCLIISLFGVFIITIDYIISSKMSLDRVKEINEFSNTLASGDYSQKELDVITRDEYGVLALNLNNFLNANKSLLGNMNETVQNSTTAANDTSLTMQDISSSAGLIVDNIEHVQQEMENQSSSVQEASGAMQQILSNIQGLNKTIDTQSAAVEESSAAVRQMVANIQSVTNILDKNAKSTRDLGDASEEGQKKIADSVRLSEMVINESSGLMEASKVIQNIASQTNLLAMNAAIEAAHAGETGKGFSVVADEIRKLAEQSNVQGKKITESLKGLGKIIAEVSQSTKQLEQQFGVIYDLTQVVKSQEGVVMNAMKEQAEGSNQVLQAIKLIDDSTLDVKNGSNQMLEGSTEIAKEMEILGNATANMSTKVSEMSSGAQQIISAVEKGNSATASNLESIQELDKEMHKFKL